MILPSASQGGVTRLLLAPHAPVFRPEQRLCRLPRLRRLLCRLSAAIPFAVTKRQCRRVDVPEVCAFIRAMPLSSRSRSLSPISSSLLRSTTTRSSIMSTRTIAVVGSTGEQGAGVVAAVLSSSSYIVRAVTRDPSSDKAKALVAAHQAHVDAGRLVVVQANLDDVESLKKAVEGAQVVFGMTTPSLNEVQQGKNLVDAVKVRLGFSSLNDDSR